MYAVPEREHFKACKHCGARGNLNLERQETITINGNQLQVKKGNYIFHCRTCGANTEA